MLSLLLLFFLLPPLTPRIFNSSLVFPSKAFTIHPPFWCLPSTCLSITALTQVPSLSPLGYFFQAVGFVYKLLYYLNCRGRGCWEESEKAGLRRNNSAPLHFHLNSHKMCKSRSWEFRVRGLPCHCPSRSPSLLPSHGKTSVGRDDCNSTDPQSHDVCASREEAHTSTCAGRHSRCGHKLQTRGWEAAGIESSRTTGVSRERLLNMTAPNTPS